MLGMHNPLQGNRKAAFAVCKHTSLACQMVAGMEDIQGKAERKQREGLRALTIIRRNDHGTDDE
jgi:hypothetical protein